MDHHAQAQSGCMQKSRFNQEKESHRNAKETSHDQEEAHYYQAKTGGAPSYALAEKETRLDQTESLSHCEGEGKGPKTCAHQEKQTSGHDPKKESHPHETN